MLLQLTTAVRGLAMRRLTPKHRKSGGVYIICAFFVAVVAANIFSVRSTPLGAEAPEQGRLARDHYEPADPHLLGASASNSASVMVPEGVTAHINGEPTRPAAQPSIAPIEASTSPPAKLPENIVINLKTPLRYTLKPGEHTPVLSHSMTDGARYEWQPHTATVWQGQQQPKLPVWAVITTPAPDAPYVQDHISFVAYAANNAQPGEYGTKIRVIIRPYVSADIPLIVTIRK